MAELRDPDDVRAARQARYRAILVQEAGIDPKLVPGGELDFAITSAYERRGYTSDDIDSWIAKCDPEVKPTWDEVECFREHVREAMAPRPSLGMYAAVIGGAALVAAFLLTRRIP